ncbi:MarR family winged helix-turn-helix transcriptional regulator [Halarcobacter anaerophilus]|jgi:DNA-binding MarR family transcriptional regulator|uniref:HTH marR-type domain-containing protein n=1 Tax=Halarcobacter anaerophilus TaxID=877500 RepID=A0A4Q0XXU1_9BACT|nr:MarR family transcriptional regulator [Halarcobacter anaerophilus]QDF30366.1 transcriptional regulator, MarR family [Halarcobacter anaerophilus]RXJ61544.1 hypothetical protein CRV06_13215 [Halarcobacter anaerophilus]
MRAELDKSILFKVNQTANLLNSSFNQVLQPFDIAIEQRITLEFIKNRKSVNQTKIAKVLAKDKTTISRTLRALESKGYIKRDEKSLDKRTNLIKLTALGEEVLEKSSYTVKSFRESLSSKLSKEEEEQLFKLLNKLLSSLKEE